MKREYSIWQRCVWILWVVFFCQTACAAKDSDKKAPAVVALTSSAFTTQQPIPAKYTCEGENISPPLSWSGVPTGAKSMVLIVDDPDAPDPQAPKMVWVHWILYDLPVSVTGLTGAIQSKELPAGTREGQNDWKKTGYGGPCPPIGRHRYFFKLYVLDVALGDLGSANKAVVEKAMAGHVIGQGELIGTYQKKS